VHEDGLDERVDGLDGRVDGVDSEADMLQGGGELQGDDALPPDDGDDDAWACPVASLPAAPLAVALLLAALLLVAWLLPAVACDDYEDLAWALA